MCMFRVGWEVGTNFLGGSLDGWKGIGEGFKTCCYLVGFGGQKTSGYCLHKRIE